jgi:hypothetical protein
MFTISYIFFGLGNLPSYETLNPRFTPKIYHENIFLGFKLLMNSLHF